MALLFLSNQIFRNSFLNLTIDYNREQFSKSLSLFEKLFDPILNLECSDKIGIDNNKLNIIDTEYKFINVSKLDFTLYLDKYKLYQSLSRWYYNQKRTNIFSKLDILFGEYFTLIDKIKEIEENSHIKYSDINSKYKDLNTKLITKLLLLKTTYNDEEVNNKIDTYCKKLEIPIIKLETIIEEVNNENESTIKEFD
jgi:hypothetical protein